MSSPAVETTGTNPLATRRELRRQRRERWLLATVATVLLLGLLIAAALVVGRQHQAVSRLRFSGDDRRVRCSPVLG